MKDVNGEKWLIVKVKHTMVDLAGGMQSIYIFSYIPILCGIPGA